MREAKELLVDVEKAAVWPQALGDKRALNRLIEEFRLTALQDALDKIERVPTEVLDDAPIDELLAVTAQVDLSVVSKTREFLSRMEAFLKGVEQEVQRLEQNAEAADPDAKAAAIGGELSGIAANLSALNEAEEVA